MLHLDANILIALDREEPEVVRRVFRWVSEGDALLVSSVVWYEFLIGPYTNEGLTLIKSLIKKPPLPFTQKDAEKAAELYNQTGRARSRKVDTMVAVIALRNGGRLVTRNVEDFRPFQEHGLELIGI